MTFASVKDNAEAWPLWNRAYISQISWSFFSCPDKATHVAVRKSLSFLILLCQEWSNWIFWSWYVQALHPLVASKLAACWSGISSFHRTLASAALPALLFFSGKEGRLRFLYLVLAPYTPFICSSSLSRPLPSLLLLCWSLKRLYPLVVIDMKIQNSQELLFFKARTPPCSAVPYSVSGKGYSKEVPTGREGCSSKMAKLEWEGPKELSHDIWRPEEDKGGEPIGEG